MNGDVQKLVTGLYYSRWCGDRVTLVRSFSLKDSKFYNFTKDPNLEWKYHFDH